ncbi:protein-glutamine gamma-glutamyltransferase K-like isoform X2 [Watersipora subatra]|uniref:protein-glutamine gamma-glutamyltransferase K-like isoform X2 n=1 Tax=Watersipora subatra TaxID=2589382 RepID=UPI00355BD437
MSGYYPSTNRYTTSGRSPGYTNPLSSRSSYSRPRSSAYARNTSSYNTYPSRPIASRLYNSNRYLTNSYTSGYTSSSYSPSTYRTASAYSPSRSDYGRPSTVSRAWAPSYSSARVPVERDVIVPSSAVITGGTGTTPNSTPTNHNAKPSQTQLEATTSKATLTAICIDTLDLLISVNTEEHHTDMYEMCEESYVDDITGRPGAAQLILRRGQEFKVKLTMNKDYSSEDHIRVVATIGPMPLVSKGTAVEMVADKSDGNKQWFTNITSFSANEVELTVNIPPTCAIGKWNLAFDTVTIAEDGSITSTMKEPVTSDVYVLFNAWCKDDAVYMENDNWRNEYVLNDSGKVYRGDSVRIYGMPWNFGQFESVSLQAAIYLLDELSDIPMTSRGNPVNISREISALVNSADENGVLMGNWSGDYSGGVSPTKWTGTPAILQKYMDTKKPVRYGQCWVFSGVMTTICRSLGLPTRSVTNYNSAHDTDGSMTIDNHYNADGDPESELDADSIWNFHVWNECWMSRPDLSAGYGGWQAVDATPQELSCGIYRAGPASVVAIRNGDVGCNYDGKFIFAEVNADRVYWFKQKNGKFIRQLEKNVVGKCISTKAVGPSKYFNSNYYNPDREDITNQYKFPEGSQEERTAVLRAATCSTKPQVYFDDSATKDINFGTPDQSKYSSVEVGSDFEVPLFIDNQSAEKRTVKLTVTLSSVYYTGVYRKNLKKEAFDKVCMRVLADDYLDDLVDFGYAMKIDYMGSVAETRQLLAKQENFRLRTLVPDVTVTKNEAIVGEKFSVSVTFKNPLQQSLTRCAFTFESAGNLKEKTVKISDVAVGAEAKADLEMVAKRHGDCVVITSFECKELGDVQGQASVVVKKK